MMDELIASASIGTGRKAPGTFAAEGELGATLAVLGNESAEARLLQTVAVVSRYEIAGRVPGLVDDLPEPAGNDNRPACTPRAADLLGRILAMTNTSAKEQLLLEWLRHAAQRGGRRLPYRLLPALFDYAAGNRRARPLVGELAGARGAWLMRQNPRWQFAAPGEEDPVAVWSIGNRDQRLAALKALRQRDPAAAVELLRSTWAEDAADDRAAFVAGLAEGLAAPDEAFLEASLDDRSKQVRQAAAELLARLPGSAYVGRMIERTTPLLTLTPGTKGGLLKRGKPAVLEVKLPRDEFDPAWGRDGIVEKPDGRMGRRQWWLEQMLAAVPPAHWSKQWGASPTECVAAAAGAEFADVVRSAWRRAAKRNPDADWVEALLLSGAREGGEALAPELLDALPIDRHDRVAAEVLSSAKVDFDALVRILNAVRQPFGAAAARAVVEKVEDRVGSARGNYDYHLAAVLQDLALRLPPSLHDELAGRWTGERWEGNRTPLDEFFVTMSLRHDTEKEFAT